MYEFVAIYMKTQKNKERRAEIIQIDPSGDTNNLTEKEAYVLALARAYNLKKKNEMFLSFSVILG